MKNLKHPSILTIITLLLLLLGLCWLIPSALITLEKSCPMGDCEPETRQVVEEVKPAAWAVCGFLLVGLFAFLGTRLNLESIQIPCVRNLGRIDFLRLIPAFLLGLCGVLPAALLVLEKACLLGDCDPDTRQLVETLEAVAWILFGSLFASLGVTINHLSTENLHKYYDVKTLWSICLLVLLAWGVYLLGNVAESEVLANSYVSGFLIYGLILGSLYGLATINKGDGNQSV